MIQFYVDKLGDCFRKAVQWTLDIPLHLSTLSVLDWDRVHSLSHHLQQQNNTYYLPEGIQWIPNALRRIQSGGDH